MQADRMLPPASSKDCAQKSRSTSSATGSGGARHRCHSASRRSGVGDGKSMIASSRRVKRLVDVGAQVGREDGEPVEGLQALQQVGALDVGVAVVGVAHLAALAEDGVGLVEEQHGVDAAGLAKIRSRFFSVSPTYLSTTVARSTVYRSRPRSAAMTSADMVLPVPESPANSAVTPCPRPPPAPHPPRRPAPCPGAGPERRARAAPGAPTAASTRSSQPTSGSIRRASRSRPAAFCARTPAPQVVGGHRRRRRASAEASGGPHGPADLPGPERRGAPPRSRVQPAPSPRWCRQQGAAASRGPRTGASTSQRCAPRSRPGPRSPARPAAPGRVGTAGAAGRAGADSPAPRPARRPGRLRAAAPPGAATGTGSTGSRLARPAAPGRATTAARPVSAQRGHAAASPVPHRRSRRCDDATARPRRARARAARPAAASYARDRSAARQHGGVRGVVPEQVGRHPVGDAQRPGQERPVGVLDDQQAGVDQGEPPAAAGRGRPPTSGRALRPAPAPARRVARRRVTSSLR